MTSTSLTTPLKSTLQVPAPPTIGVVVSYPYVALVARLGSLARDATTISLADHGVIPDPASVRAGAEHVVTEITSLTQDYSDYSWHIAIQVPPSEGEGQQVAFYLLGRYPDALLVAHDAYGGNGYKHRRPSSHLTGDGCYPASLRSRRPRHFRYCWAPKGMRDYEQAAFDVAGVPWFYLAEGAEL
jgi:hypothetical protein